MFGCFTYCIGDVKMYQLSENTDDWKLIHSIQSFQDFCRQRELWSLHIGLVTTNACGFLQAFDLTLPTEEVRGFLWVKGISLSLDSATVVRCLLVKFDVHVHHYTALPESEDCTQTLLCVLGPVEIFTSLYTAFFHMFCFVSVVLISSYRSGHGSSGCRVYFEMHWIMRWEEFFNSPAGALFSMNSIIEQFPSMK